MVTASSSRSHASESADHDVSTDELAERAMAYCRDRNLKIAAAESLTGGLLADAFVRIPGASEVFVGSAVTYDIRAKASILHVDRALLTQQGAVHPDVARQMALGVSNLFAQPEYFHGLFGLATTGVAGPGPDEDGKPAGLVYVAMAAPSAPGNLAAKTADIESLESSVVVRRLMLKGSRAQIRRATVRQALQLITRFIGDSQE